MIEPKSDWIKELETDIRDDRIDLDGDNILLVCPTPCTADDQPYLNVRALPSHGEAIMWPMSKTYGSDRSVG